jgi:Ca2+/Na+ antiporter
MSPGTSPNGSAGDRPARAASAIDVIRPLANAAVVVIVMVGVYWVFPIQDSVDWRWAVRLVIGVALTFALMGREFWAVQRSSRPVVRAVRALTATLAVFVVTFSLTYLAVSHSDVKSFSQPLNKIGAAYFTVSTMATVGFGDITPVSDGARLLVIVQILLDLVVLAVGARLLVRTATMTMSRRRSEAAPTESALGMDGY